MWDFLFYFYLISSKNKNLKKRVRKIEKSAIQYEIIAIFLFSNMRKLSFLYLSINILISFYGFYGFMFIPHNYLRKTIDVVL